MHNFKYFSFKYYKKKVYVSYKFLLYNKNSNNNAQKLY